MKFPFFHLSVRTIDGYRDALFEKLHVRTRVGLVMYVSGQGLRRHKQGCKSPYICRNPLGYDQVFHCPFDRDKFAFV
jgi:hypothetical protein